MRLQRHAAQRVQTIRPEKSFHLAKSLHLLPLIAFCTAAKAALLQAQAQSLHLCDALVPNQKASRVRPGFSPGPRTPCHTTPFETNNRTPQAGVHGRRRKPSLASLLKIGASNFCAKQARVRDAKGWTQGRRDGAAGSRCKIPGEADLQEDARLAASLVQMHTGSCG